MKSIRLILTLAALAYLAALPTGHATLFLIDISPAGGTALNLGANPYAGDHAIGLAAPNETTPPVSAATGNEVGAGIVYDDVTNMLMFDFAYGSAFGFVDLRGSFTLVHIHAPGPVNFPAPNSGAGVIHDLAAFHAASTPFSGRITGTVVLSAGEEVDLFDNELYFNVHSAFAGGGEIRGQLIPVIPEPSTLSFLGIALFGLLLRRGRPSS